MVQHHICCNKLVISILEKNVRMNGSVSCPFDCVLGRVILDEHFCSLWCCGPRRAMASLFVKFLDHTK